MKYITINILHQNVLYQTYFWFLICYFAVAMDLKYTSEQKASRCPQKTAELNLWDNGPHKATEHLTDERRANWGKR